MIEKFQLSNGMNVLLQQSKKSPVVSVQMWVKTGSADEKKGEEGISHFIEHLVFKGTRKFNVGEIASTVEGSGGELNAYTSFDQTVFYVTISKQFTEVALEVIQEMMGFPKFDPKEIDNEREVVCEEIKRSNDSPGRQSSQLLFSTVYAKHPYGIPVIGYDKNVKRFTSAEIKDYYNRRYVPKNMSLVVVGDFESKEIRREIEKKYSEFAPNKLAEIARAIEPKQQQPRTKVQIQKFEQALINIAWKIPGVKSEDTPAVDVLAMILGQGDSSRLTQSLRIDKAIANSISAYSYTPKDNGILAISAGLNPDNLDEFLDKVGEEILLLLDGGVTQEEIQRAVISTESDEFFGMETVDGLANKIGTFQNLFDDPEYFKTYIAQIGKVTPSDVAAVAKKYIISETLSVTMLAPKDQKKMQAKVDRWSNDLKVALDVVGRFEKSQSKNSAKAMNQKTSFKIAASGKRATSPRAEKVVLSNGATLVFKPSYETPTVSVVAAFRGGVREERHLPNGAAEMLGRTWTSGTTTRTEQDIISETEKNAIHLGAGGGKNSFRLSVDFLQPFTEKAMDLFWDSLTGPVFPEDILAREKLVALEQIKSRQDNPGHLVVQNFMKTMFAGHPYAKDQLGEADSLKKVNSQTVKELWKTVQGTKNLVIVVAGDVDPVETQKQAEQKLKSVPRLSRLNEVFTHKGPTKDQVLYLNLEKEQSHVVCGYKALTLADPKKYTLMIIQSILAGQGGRLFLNLRDKASLAYSVSPMRMEGVDTGYFGAYIACSPEKVEKAVEMMQIEFSKLASEKVSAIELDRSMRYLVGRHDIELQRNSSIANSILFDELYGMDPNDTFRFAEKLKEVTANDILNLAQEIFKQPKVISVVGPRKPKL
jgi:zinc protease